MKKETYLKKKKKIYSFYSFYFLSFSYFFLLLILIFVAIFILCSSSSLLLLLFYYFYVVNAMQLQLQGCLRKPVGLREREMNGRCVKFKEWENLREIWAFSHRLALPSFIFLLFLLLVFSSSFPSKKKFQFWIHFVMNSFSFEKRLSCFSNSVAFF